VVHDPLLEGYSRLLSSCAGLESAVTKMWATDTAATISWDSESGGVVVEEKRIPAWQQALVVSQVCTSECLSCYDVSLMLLMYLIACLQLCSSV
jgi:hypothetical protein